MNQDTFVLVVVIFMLLLGITPLFILFIQASIDVHESSKETKKIREEIRTMIDRM